MKRQLFHRLVARAKRIRLLALGEGMGGVKEIKGKMRKGTVARCTVPLKYCFGV